MKKPIKPLWRLLAILAVMAFALISLLVFTGKSFVSAASSSSVKPFDAPGAGLLYNGGPVLQGNIKVYTIFWAPAGQKFPGAYQSLQNRFFQDFSQSRVFSIIHQYKDKQGHNPRSVSLGGTFTDTRPYPYAVRGYVTDGDLNLEVINVTKKLHWPTGLGSIYFVYTTSGTRVCQDGAGRFCSNGGFCSYHEDFQAGDLNKTYLYASIPYEQQGCGIPASPNHNISADGAIDASSRELMGSLSDPIVYSGWHNDRLGDIGDPCQNQYAPRNASGADLVINGHSYLIQKEWSNRAKGCSFGPN